MASSVARMPSDDWRDPSRLSGVGVYLPCVNLKVRTHSPAAAAVAGDDDPSTATGAGGRSSSRRQCRILDMWASRQARDMATTIERQAHEAEITALANASQPVSARAATFRRPEASPTALDGSGGIGIHVRAPGARASSLIQMWRELEAEAGTSPTPRAVAGAPLSSSEYCESDRSSGTPPPPTESSEKSRVGDIVRLLSSETGRKQGGSERPAAEQSRVSGRRGRYEMEEELAAIMANGRRTELAALAGRHAVSRFPHRGRIQTQLRLIALRREGGERCSVPSPPPELELLQNRSTISHLRQRFIHGSSQQEGRTLQAMENQQPLSNTGSSNRLPNLYQEEASPSDSESTAASSEGMQEGTLSPDIEWEDGSPNQTTSLDSSSASPSWQEEEVLLAEEPELCSVVGTQQHTPSNCCSWVVDHPNSWRRREECSSANKEILELLERRRVSTSLASSFRDKMDRLISLFLRTQKQQSFEEGFDEEGDADVPTWRQDVGRSPGVTVSSSSLDMGSPYDDLRTEVAGIRHEINELRKLVDSCMPWQANLQLSIRQEVYAAVHQSVGLENSLSWVLTRKGSCCICCEMQVDSLLYRCGHMCTCFKCAHELQWSGGRCPICRSLILDVVRAFPNS